MNTPFDEVIDNIKTEHYHNHRQQMHSDIVSRGIFRDLMDRCPELKHDIDTKVIRSWINIESPTR